MLKRKFIIEWVNVIMSIEGQRDREIGRWSDNKKYDLLIEPLCPLRQTLWSFMVFFFLTTEFTEFYTEFTEYFVPSL